MINRIEQIKKKGFAMKSDIDDMMPSTYNPVDFSKIKVGMKTLEDAIINLGDYRKVNPRLADKTFVLQAINSNNYEAMREISNFFYRTSGIYSRLCRYMAYLYRYDWMVTPYIGDGAKPEKVLDGFNKVLLFLDNFQIKKFFGEVALKVIRNGCYYGYLIPQEGKMNVQELPPRYCRTRYMVNGKPAVEFNMKFFDECFTDSVQRMRILKLFPNEFKKGYVAYKEGKLSPDYAGDEAGWYLLDIDNVIKFNINGEDFPAFVSVIPSIIDLDKAQDLDRQKMQQQLLKIIIQKMPVDKNGDLVFDIDEAQQLHNNAVKMLGRAIGIDVLTTFAEVEVADMSDKSTTTKDELEKVERTVYNEAGVSQMQFNTDGNIALEKSILNDEASMYNLLLQFEAFLNGLLAPFNKTPKKVYYKVQLLTTTIYNYKDMAKLYKEQTQLGYSKMLPQIALGQSQSSILANAYFENDILDLINLFIPPLMSSTMNAEMLNNKSGNNNNNNNSSSNQNNSEGNGEVGRNEKPDDEKSERTLKNKESMN